MTTSGNDFDVVGEMAKIEAEADLDLVESVSILNLNEIPADLSNLPIEKTREGKYLWNRFDRVTVVATDLKSSTAVSYSEQDKTGAALYQASTGGCAKVINRFDPNVVEIQGDGIFAIFTGDDQIERAMCCAISLNHFGKHLANELAEKLGDQVEAMKASGLRIGVSTGTLLAKRIGVRGDRNAPVWAGKPVNFASKCSQAAEVGQIVVTEATFEEFSGNEYLIYSCGHSNGVLGTPGTLWKEVQVEALGDEYSTCYALGSVWCGDHGNEFCNAILRGETKRDDLDAEDLPALIEASEEAPE